ncbi:hypothetical protein LWF01_02985 [Saxibacter everestensis]|uniref:Uncharacterized protein n=1 Tax=Saxibacter everestensis TaxID=2909229 RepID=A0ABY8QUP9_9MICO|nr:hypothetical protein LWF01_02985 [Brevibacteriaceae bacterium ZFBP1038]
MDEPSKSWFGRHIVLTVVLAAVGVLFVGLVLLGVIGAAVGGVPDEPVAAAKTTAPPTTEAPKETPKPAKTTTPEKKAEPQKTEPQKPETKAAPKVSDEDKLRKGLSTAVEGTKLTEFTSGGIIRVEFPLGDNLTNNLIRAGAQADTVAILKTVKESGVKFDEVMIDGTFPMVDQYGNEQDDALVLSVSYTQDTVKKINFDNVLASNIWDLSDTPAFIHPEFR